MVFDVQVDQDVDGVYSLSETWLFLQTALVELNPLVDLRLEFLVPKVRYFNYFPDLEQLWFALVELFKQVNILLFVHYLVWVLLLFLFDVLNSF